MKRWSGPPGGGTPRGSVRGIGRGAPLAHGTPACRALTHERLLYRIPVNLHGRSGCRRRCPSQRVKTPGGARRRFRNYGAAWRGAGGSASGGHGQPVPSAGNPPRPAPPDRGGPPRRRRRPQGEHPRAHGPSTSFTHATAWAPIGHFRLRVRAQPRGLVGAEYDEPGAHSCPTFARRHSFRVRATTAETGERPCTQRHRIVHTRGRIQLPGAPSRGRSIREATPGSPRAAVPPSVGSARVCFEVVARI